MNVNHEEMWLLDRLSPKAVALTLGKKRGGQNYITGFLYELLNCVHEIVDHAHAFLQRQPLYPNNDVHHPDQIFVRQGIRALVDDIHVSTPEVLRYLQAEIGP